MKWAKKNQRVTIATTSIVCGVLSCLLPDTVRADAALEGTNPAQWRIVWTSDPATAATVCWNTAKEGTSHRVRYRLRGKDDWIEVACHRNGRYRARLIGELYYHHAALAELQPETEYDVQLVSDDDESPVMFFKTAPEVDRSLSLLFGGDSRSDRQTRRKVNELIGELFGQSTAAGSDPSAEIFAFVHGGDYIATGSSLSQWSAWMSDHELTTSAAGRLLPIIPARGNHDRGPLFNPVFGFPEDDKNYYAVNVGPQIRMVTLNTEISVAGDQAAWLAKELAQSRPRHRWLIAQYHRPAWPAVKSPSAALQHWVPLFEQHHMDLVCEADGHNIKRTVPIRGGRYDQTGIVYIGEGGLGVPQRTPKTERWYLQKPGMAAKGHHVQLLTFTQEKLTYQCVLLNRSVLETYTRPPRETSSTP